MIDRKEYMKQYHLKNKEKIKQYRINNKDKISKRMKGYYIENKGKIKEYYKDNKEKILENGKQWRKDNPGKMKQYTKNNKKYQCQWRIDNIEHSRGYVNQWGRNKHRIDMKFNLNHKMRYAIWKSLKGNKNGRSWGTLVDYSIDKLMKHLKKTLPIGYTWQDYMNGGLHVDHILPIRLFQFQTPEDKEFKDCWALYNLRLLPAKDNLLKNDTINNPILLGLMIKELI